MCFGITLVNTPGIGLDAWGRFEHEMDQKTLWLINNSPVGLWVLLPIFHFVLTSDFFLLYIHSKPFSSQLWTIKVS